MFLVMRTHTLSHCADTVLWQVVSKPFDSRSKAQEWCEFCQAEYLDNHPKGVHKFFVIETDFAMTIPC